jgi:hypothetical protein
MVFTRPGEKRRMMICVSAGKSGRSALISRVTSSYFLSASTKVSNSMAVNDTPSRIEVSIFITSSSAARRSSMGLETSRSRSFGSAPG